MALLEELLTDCITAFSNTMEDTPLKSTRPTALTIAPSSDEFIKPDKETEPAALIVAASNVIDAEPINEIVPIPAF